MVQNSFELQKRLKNYSKNWIFSKFSNDPKNVSRHCGVHYNIKNKHFKDFSGGGSWTPPMSNRVNPVSYGGVGYCISCLENGLQQSQFWVLSPKKLMTIFLVKFWVVASAINNTPPPLHPSSVFVSIPDRVNPDYVLRLMLVQKSHVALCFFPLTTSKHQALVLQNSNCQNQR